MQKLQRCLLFFIVFVMMLTRVNSSPLFNLPGGDSAVFITMGRAMAIGKVLYKEIFDHKGFYVYFLNFLGVLITPRTLVGLFIVETIFMLVNTVLIFKIACEFQDNRSSFLSTLLMIAFILNPFIFQGGNLTEEYTLSFQLFSVYILIKNRCPFTMFLHGLMVGIVLNLRPNHVLMWLPIALLPCGEAVFNKDFKKLILTVLYGIVGIIVGIFPVVLFTICNDAFHDVMFGTFSYNFLYIADSNISFLLKLLNIFSAQWWLFGAILVSSIIVIKKKIFIAYYFSMLCMSIIAIALSGRTYGHYYEYIAPFTLPLILYCSHCCIKFFTQRNIVYVFCVLMIVYIPVTARKINNAKEINNVYNRFMETSNNQKKVLVTGNMPAFYVYIQAVPDDKYFYIPSNSYEMFSEPTNSQIASILSGKNDIVITSNRSLKRISESGKLNEVKTKLADCYTLSYSAFSVHQSDDIKVYIRNEFT